MTAKTSVPIRIGERRELNGRIAIVENIERGRVVYRNEGDGKGPTAARYRCLPSAWRLRTLVQP